MGQSLPQRALLYFLSLLSSSAFATVDVTSSFNGALFSGVITSSSDIAVGPQYVVETVEGVITIFDRNGNFFSSQSFDQLFSGFERGTSGRFNPTVIYDPGAGRFVIASQVVDQWNNKAWVAIAVSDSSDPTQGFSARAQIEIDEGGLYWIDNGKIGFNTDAYVFSGDGDSFSSTGSTQEIILTIDKSSVLSQGASTFKYTQSNLTNVLYFGSAGQQGAPNPFAMKPASMYGSKSGDPMWFVETYPGSTNTVLVAREDNVLSAAPTFTYYMLPCNPYSDSNSILQPGGTMRLMDSRTLKVVWNNRFLVSAFNSDAGTDGGAAWFEFDTGGASPVILQQGVVHPGVGISTYNPSVAVDANGNIGMTYSESSATEYESMYITGRLVSDPPGTMQSPVRVASGMATPPCVFSRRRNSSANLIYCPKGTR